MEYSYYPGCSLKGTARDYAQAIERLLYKLNLNFIELPNWVCCGASPAHLPDEKAGLAISALTITEALKYNRDLVVACAACYNRLKTTNIFLEKKPESKIEIENLIESQLTGKIRIRHLLEVIIEDVKTEIIASKLKKSLQGLKAACYYGCLLSRPEGMLENDLVENPKMMDNIIEITGATPVSWPYKTECCGASFGVSEPKISLQLSGKILKSARDNGAECIIVACPLCHANLDLRQLEIDKFYNDKFHLPIFYFPELLAIALGEEHQNLALDKHIVDPLPLLKRKGFI
ncbi:MAG: CoB--CoM heterodisulfide reductase iron-sulfur subunit B family protein [Candidatus Firestonebacteria bacterium]|nr:CoB--CoM heterodisulfide reductase iron-sulfur subunit B family protein [Candidatus Firestonebacteria bacterium]